MNGRRAVVGLALLCTAVLCACAAPAASALGTTAFTCKEGASSATKFSDAHCTKASAEGKFGHAEVAVGTETAFTATNGQTASETTAATPLVIRSVTEKLEIEVECTGVTASGSLTGGEFSGEMYVSGTSTFAITACTVLKPTAISCVVTGGKLEPKALSQTTLGQGEKIRFGPASGTAILTFKLEKCTTGSLNKEYTLEGSWKASRSGTTLTSTHAGTTTDGTLTLNKEKAGLASAITLRAKKAGGGEGETPLAFTYSTEEPKLGTTAFTCKAGAETLRRFSDAHCAQEQIGGGFGHVTVENAIETPLSVTNAKTASETTAAAPFKLKGLLKGVFEFEISCTGASGTGGVVNSKSGEEMVTSGTVTLSMSGCTAPKPSGQECKVKEEKFSTEKLAFTSLAQGMSLRLQPAVGVTFATFTIENCKTATINAIYQMVGTWNVTPSGATLSSTHAGVTEQNSLKIGTKAGIETTLTLSAKETPLAFTTG